MSRPLFTKKTERTLEEMQEMVDALTEELDSLPARNAWGESNADSKKELRSMIQEIQLAMKYGEYDTSLDSEATAWLAGDDTLGYDYGLIKR